MVTREELIDWIKSYDLEPKQVKAIEIVPRGRLKGDGVYMRVTLFAKDAAGDRFMCLSAFCDARHAEYAHTHGERAEGQNGDEVPPRPTLHLAEEVRWVPLQTFPETARELAG